MSKYFNLLCSIIITLCLALTAVDASAQSYNIERKKNNTTAPAKSSSKSSKKKQASASDSKTKGKTTKKDDTDAGGASAKDDKYAKAPLSKQRMGVTIHGDTLIYVPETRTINCNNLYFYNFKGVEGTKFTMGEISENEKKGDSQNVVLSAYYIGSTEVPQWLWSAVMDTNPSPYKDNMYPVTNISWDDCMTFLKRLNTLLKCDFTLPTEAQWEFAARGGVQTRDYTYSGSNNANSVGWFDTNSKGAINRVETRYPNELDIYDMSGNAMEWCFDWEAPYAKTGSQWNPYGPIDGTKKILRGGSYKDNIDGISVTKRYSLPRDSRADNIGFRIALQP